MVERTQTSTIPQSAAAAREADAMARAARIA
jgi:hypothetical protein